MIDVELLDKFSYVTTIIDNEPCYLFLYRQYYDGINLYKKAQEGNLIYATLLAELDLALQQLNAQQRKAFELNIMYDKPIANKYKYLIDEAKAIIKIYLCTPEDVMYIMGVKNDE